MKCIYCNPTLLGKSSKTRIKHKQCTDKPDDKLVIREYEVAN